MKSPGSPFRATTKLQQRGFSQLYPMATNTMSKQLVSRIRTCATISFRDVPRRQLFSASTRDLWTSEQLSCPRRASTTASPLGKSTRSSTRHLHTTSSAFRGQQDLEPSGPKQETTASDLDRLDVLGAVPVPSHSVELCMSDGFQLNSGAEVRDGAGVLLVGGEGFAWQPWLAGDRGKRLVNEKGQWDIPEESLALLGLVWPRPDILILGLGPEIRPLAPNVRKHIASLGMRVDVMDTHNAAAQFNLLVRERGIDEIAAALVPLGWREGQGAAL